MISRVLYAAHATDASSKPSSNDRRDAIRSCRDNRRDGLDTVARSESATTTMSSPQRISSRHTRRCSTELATIAACARVSVPAAPGGGGSGEPAHGSGRAPRQSAGGSRASGAGPGCNGRSLMTAGRAVNAPRSVSHFTFGRVSPAHVTSSTSARNLAATSTPSNRSRFFENVE
jgi:hypothetical protein